MSELIRPRFEAYISLDISQPLTEIIYDIRESLGDRKMAVMPVDLPLFGHFDNNMILMRHFDEVDALIKDVLGVLKKRSTDLDILKLKVDQFRRLSNDLVILDIYRNPWIDHFMQILVEEADRNGLEYIRSLKSVKHYAQGNGPISKTLPVYVCCDPATLWHEGQTDNLIERLNSRIEKIEPLEIKNLTFYHKEAVPLTRIQSWEIL